MRWGVGVVVVGAVAAVSLCGLTSDPSPPPLKAREVVAVGAAETAAAVDQAPKFPAVRFVVIGASAAGANIAEINGSGDAEVTAKVRGLLVDAFGGHFAPGPVTSP